jgi:hypothetical protein
LELGLELCFKLVNQALYLLSHTSSPFLLLFILEMGVSRAVCQGCP